MKLLFVIFSFLAIGCPNGSVTGLGYLAMGWKPDGSGIVAILQDFGEYPYIDLGSVVVSYDDDGKETKRVFIQRPAINDDFSDKLFFGPDGKRFFANVEDDIHLIDPETGSQELIIESYHVVSVSSSGRLVLAESQMGDSAYQSIFSVVGSTPNVISTISWFNPLHANNASRADYTFIGDSLLTICFCDTIDCSLAFYDTLFNLKLVAKGANRPLMPAFAAATNKLLYLSETAFTLYDFASNSITVVQEAPERVNAQSISPDATFILYTVNDDGNYSINPSSLFIVDINTKVINQLASNLRSSGHLSSDGKSVAFFTRADQIGNDPQLNILNVP